MITFFEDTDHFETSQSYSYRYFPATKLLIPDKYCRKCYQGQSKEQDEVHEPWSSLIMH